MPIETKPWDAAEVLNTPADIAAYPIARSLGPGASLSDNGNEAPVRTSRSQRRKVVR
jgi:hypothetical protein